MTKIRVALRVRPLSQREIDENHPVVVAVENNSAFITDIRVPERPSADSRPRYRQFDFDHTFWFTPSECPTDSNGQCHYKRPAVSASQIEVYNEMGPYLEKAILAGYNACLLAYGQSGSGKTHTMIGSREDPGIIPRLCRSLWDKLGETYPPLSPDKPGFRMEVSFLEIYREKVRDLLNPTNALKLREHPQLGPHVQGLTRLEVNGETSLLDLLWEGERRRANGNTSTNRRSSRSHTIWTLYLTVFTATDSTTTSYSSNQVDIDSQSGCSGGPRRGSNRGGRRHSDSPEKVDSDDSTKKIITNQVHLVDLAGSEKADCTTAKSLLAEGADINRSLVALGNVISALAEKAQYVPYRDSALTWLLKDSIGGNASTSIIITASPSSHCHAQTLNSLRFAQRARLVENTPKINLAPASSSHYGPYGFLSVMSAMDLKKDISRLAKIIKTAQNNGGILRGLAPRAGWTRLIHAIEGIGEAEKEQLRLQQERACSEDTTASSSQGGPSTSSTGGGITSSSSSATITATKSLNDVMVQADMEKRNPLLHRRSSRQSESAIAAAISSSSPTKSHSKIVGTEVFIPTSSSYKCLTWQQEETHPVPKPLSSSNSSLVSSEGDDASGNQSPSSSNCQIHHLKYMLEVHYPVAHNLDHASRISERIHGNIIDENYSKKTELIPMEVQPSVMDSTSPLVQDLVPTLVNPRDLEEVLCEEVETRESEELKESLRKSQTVLVGQIGKESKDYLFPMKCKHFANTLAIPISPFESSDENEFDEPEQIPLAYPGVYRAIHPEIAKSLQRTLNSEPNCTFDDTCYFTAAESYLSQIPSMVISSSSSYESINMPDTVRPVNLIREFSETNDISEDHAEDFTVDNEVFMEDYQPPVANVCLVPGQPMETAEPIEILVAEPNCLDNAPCYNPINGVSDSKFRNYFAKELLQMDRMGKQIKSLLQMTQRFNVVKPYLDEISDLQNSDHSRPDPSLDAHIDSCSGWNVDVELSKVHHEIRQLNKVLKTGLGTDGMASSSAEKRMQDRGRIPANLTCSSSSTIHNDAGGLTSDDSGSMDADGYFHSSFAHTRHIPLLSGKANSHKREPSRLNYDVHPFGSTHLHPFGPAKSSNSQPTMSSSSNNDSMTSTSTSGTTAPGELHFRPNIFSTPKQRGASSSHGHWRTNGNETDEDTAGHSNLRANHHHLPPSATAKSMEVFYRNPDGLSSLPYFPSNSNMSSGSSSSAIGLNNPETSQKLPNGRFPLNGSHSEPRIFSGQHSSSRGLMRLSESSTNFQSYHSHSLSQHPQHHRHPQQLPSANSFNPDEIRSHRHLYENRLSSESVKVEKGLSLGKGLNGWDYNYAGANNGMEEIPEFDYPLQFQYNHRHSRSATADSMDLCSCGDTNSKYSASTGTGAPLSSLEKSSSRSQFSSFGGSTTTDSDFLLGGRSLPSNPDYHFPNHNQLHHHPSQSQSHSHSQSKFSSSDAEGHGLSHSQNHHIYLPKGLRNADN